MSLFSYHYNIGLLLFVILFVYISWKRFLSEFKYEKVFDFTLFFLLFGYLFDRAASFSLNWEEIEQLPLTFANIINIFNPDKYQDFSISLFILGGLVGTSLYNWINSIYKLENHHLDELFRSVIISLVPLLLLGSFKSFILDKESSETIYYVTFMFLIALLLFLYYFKKTKSLMKRGFFASLTIFCIAIANIFLKYTSPDFKPVVLNLFDLDQVASICLIIGSIDILLTGISAIQDQNIRKSLPPKKQNLRGFSISFANKRRVTNPLNIRLKNLTQGNSRLRRTRT